MIVCSKVASLRKRMAGKSLPIEKFCETKAARYAKRGALLFAHYVSESGVWGVLQELFYIWNGFQLLKMDGELVKPIMADVSAVVDNKLNVLTDVDDRCLCLLLKAMCWRSLQSPFRAEQCLLEIVAK